MKNKVFIGWDPREDIAYQVSEHSIISRSPNADVCPLVQADLRTVGLYTRPIDPLSSTEFTFTRFLIPAIMNYQGWAMFTDCDIIFLEDVLRLAGATTVLGFDLDCCGFSSSTSSKFSGNLLRIVSSIRL